MKFQNEAGEQVTVANEVMGAAVSPPAAPTPAQLANAESDRLDALEEAETAAEDRDGYRRELARVRADVRRLEAALRAERHEHAEARAMLARQTAPSARPSDSEAGTGKDDGEGATKRSVANAGDCEVNP